MSYNILSYSIYIPVICFITVKIGWLFYKHGEIFLLNIFEYNKTLVNSVNNLLLIGYYLVNLGYAIFTIAYWEHIESINQLINTLSTTLGRIIILLAVLHYNNILILTYIIKSKSLKQ